MAKSCLHTRLCTYPTNVCSNRRVSLNLCRRTGNFNFHLCDKRAAIYQMTLPRPHPKIRNMDFLNKALTCCSWKTNYKSLNRKLFSHTWGFSLILNKNYNHINIKWLTILIFAIFFLVFDSRKVWDPVLHIFNVNSAFYSRFNLFFILIFYCFK